MNKLTYEVIPSNGIDQEVIKKTDTNGAVWWIPLDPANSDYQRYLRWLEDPTAEESGTLS